jgi:type IV pilus assembly protein PilB
VASGSTGTHMGRFLVETGVITQEQLETALQKQEQWKDRKLFLGQVLIELGFATETAVARAIAAQAGVPFITLEDYPVDESAVKLLDPTVIRRYQALPIGFEDGALLVAMAQPRNIIAIEDIRILTGMEVRPVLVTDTELITHMERLLSPKMDVEVVTDEYEPEIVVAGEAGDRPAVKLADAIIGQAVQAKASDVHIEPLEGGFRVRFRIDGVLHEVMHPPRHLHPSLVSRIKVLSNMDIAERRIPQDGRATIRVDDRLIDIRTASLPTAYGEKLTLRILDRQAKILNFQDLGFPEDKLEEFNEIIHLPYGMILVTGPTGSGKSTTLYSILNTLNRADKHIITIEDPVERRIDGVNQIQVNVQAGVTFASGLRSILRNDPDIVMVGEIRDQETARIAVESSLTGHLVLSTLHTNDAAGAITRLNDMEIEPYLTASSLACVIAQRLVRTLCPHCKQPVELTREELAKSIPDFPGENDHALIYQAKGCAYCSNTGYRGRIGVFEMLVVSERIAKLAIERRSAREIRQAAIEEGMITLRQQGLRFLHQGLTSLEEVLRVIV